MTINKYRYSVNGQFTDLTPINRKPNNKIILRMLELLQNNLLTINLKRAHNSFL